MLPGIDTRTVSVVAFVVYVALAVIMVHVRATRRVYPGFTDWTVSQVLLAVGMVLVSQAGKVATWIPLILGSGLILLAQPLIYDGFMRFFGLTRGRTWGHYGLLAATLAGYGWSLLYDDRVVLRLILFSSFTAFMMLRIAAALLTRPQIRREPPAQLIAAAALLMGGFNIIHGVASTQMELEHLFRDDYLLPVRLFFSIVVSILLVFGFQQLVQARMEAELKAAQIEAEELANTDRLTGAWNRRRFESEALREIERAIRYNQPLSLILFDIDHFKQINDRHGHQAGDYVLTTLYSRVRGRIRGADALTRWGGDEFVILAPMTTACEAEALAEGLRSAVADHEFGTVGKVTLSMGVAEFRPPESLDAWMARADRGLYEAKAGGRDQVAASAA